MKISDNELCLNDGLVLGTCDACLEIKKLVEINKLIKENEEEKKKYPSFSLSESPYLNVRRMIISSQAKHLLDFHCTCKK